MQADSVVSRADRPAPNRRGGWGLLWVVLGLCCAIELVLGLADLGWIGSPRWRGLAYQNGAFWAGLLYDWRPNYAAQPVTMFLSYAFLHAGLWHLAGNMLTLLFLGPLALARVGAGGFALLYAAAAVGGAWAFGLLSASPAPMVGASGALFGLAGAWQYWEWSDLRRAGRPVAPVARMLAALVGLNAMIWWTTGGLIAWETHLGGFVAGWVGAWVLGRV